MAKKQVEQDDKQSDNDLGQLDKSDWQQVLAEEALLDGGELEDEIDDPYADDYIDDEGDVCPKCGQLMENCECDDEDEESDDEDGDDEENNEEDEEGDQGGEGDDKKDTGDERTGDKDKNGEKDEKAEGKGKKGKDGGGEGEKGKDKEPLGLEYLVKTWDILVKFPATQPLCQSLNSALRESIGSATVGVGYVLVPIGWLNKIMGKKGYADDTIGFILDILNGTVAQMIQLKGLVDKILKEVKPIQELLKKIDEIGKPALEAMNKAGGGAGGGAAGGGA